MPALFLVSVSEVGNGKVRDADAPYKTPMLMASSAPSFSFLLIATVQTIFHGRMASVMSIAPEKAMMRQLCLPSLSLSAAICRH